MSITYPLEHFYALIFQESIPLAEEPSFSEPAEADEAETPALAEEPMETVTVSLTKKKGEIIQRTTVWLNWSAMKRIILIGSLSSLNFIRQYGPLTNFFRRLILSIYCTK